MAPSTARSPSAAMTIRSKLLMLYAVMLITLLTTGLVYYLAISRWSHAASELSGIHRQNELAELLRAGIQHQVNRALDYLGGDLEAASEVKRLEAPLLHRLDELEQMADRRGELLHLEGLRETWSELAFTLDRVITPDLAAWGPRSLEAARTRLREIASEVTEDVAVLNQYYRSEVDADILDAARAGRFAELATGAAVAAVVLEMVLLVVLSQRWLVKPIAEVSTAAERISTGDFATRINLSSGSEWQKLTHSINHMAASLADLKQKLIGRERLATLGEAAAYTAHNIRNPLAAIRMTAQVTRDELASSEGTASESLTEIMSTVDRLDAWARRFLEFARPFELKAAPTDVNELVSHTAALVARKFAVLPVDIETKLDFALPAAHVDAVLLEQAVAALITNALEAGSQRVEVATGLHHHASGALRFTIMVRDDGKGIAPELQARLFRAFVSDKPGGTGLGLAQARAIIEIHGGQLMLESSPGKGTRVTLDLPVTHSVDTAGASRPT